MPAHMHLFMCVICIYIHSSSLVSCYIISFADIISEANEADNYDHLQNFKILNSKVDMYCNMKRCILYVYI